MYKLQEYTTFFECVYLQRITADLAAFAVKHKTKVRKARAVIKRTSDWPAYSELLYRQYLVSRSSRFLCMYIFSTETTRKNVQKLAVHSLLNVECNRQSI